MDYRRLNAVIVKNKHPLPIVDELIDELAGATWFSKLDFRSGYHQIRIAKGDEYKIAFKTHNGMYEFLVIPFGSNQCTSHISVCYESTFCTSHEKRSSGLYG